MKNVLTLTLLAIALLFCSCVKEGTPVATQEQSPNRVITIPGNGKTSGSTILQMRIGHNGKNCSGCVMYNGRLVHVNCMGDGNYCGASVSVQLQQIGTAITATTTDTFDLTSEDFFLMPDRSLNYRDEIGNPVFLNIPEQMVYRDTATQQFTFTGLFISDDVVYTND